MSDAETEPGTPDTGGPRAAEPASGSPLGSRRSVTASARCVSIWLGRARRCGRSTSCCPPTRALPATAPVTGLAKRHGEFYVEAAAEHLGALQTRCNELPAARATRHVNDRYTERLPNPPSTPRPTPRRRGHEAGRQGDAGGDQPSRSNHTACSTTLRSQPRRRSRRPKALLGPGRTYATGDARGVTVTAGRMRRQSLPQIARHSDRDHTIVLHATRRIEKIPPLRERAAKIASQWPSNGTPASALIVRTAPHKGGELPSDLVSVGEEAHSRPSPGAQKQRHQGSAQRGDRQSRVAR